MNKSELTVPPIVSPPPAELLRRYLKLKEYVNLTTKDVELAKACWTLVEPTVAALVDDFYDEILKHEETRRVLSSESQVIRLKASLAKWVQELFISEHDEKFVYRRWLVGYRHVEIGLAHVWVTAAMTRLRERLLSMLKLNWNQGLEEFADSASAIRRLMDLDLALIEDAYHTESVAQQISQERDFAEGVIETAQAIVMVVTLEGKVIRSNAFLDELVSAESGGKGMSASATHLFAGRDLNIFELIPKDQHERVRAYLLDASNGVSVKPLETQFRLKSGENRSIRWLAKAFLASAIPDRNKAPGATSKYDISETVRDGVGEAPLQRMVLCVGQDITDLREAQRSLVRQERLAAIGQTMTGLAHESRNAFQRSQASLETLLLELEDRPAAVQLIERIQRAHDHLLHLYEEVLQFARPVRLELQAVRLEIHIQQTWSYILQTGSTNGIHLKIDNRTANDEIWADPFAIEQVLRNLLENAAQASEPKSDIDVVIRDTWIESSEAIEIEVRDYGKGLPKEYIDRIFEPFFTTRSRGTGLGLPIARRLVESHGGTLRLENAEEKGCRAILILPRRAVPEKALEFAAEDTRRIKTEHRDR